METSNMRMKEPSFEGRLILVILILLGISFLLPFGFPNPITSYSGIEVDDGVLQEKIGYAILVSSRWDLDRQSILEKQHQTLVQKTLNSRKTQRARIQETIGFTLARESQKILNKQALLKNKIETAQSTLQDLREKEPYRRQEQLGMAVLTAYRRGALTGEAFQSAFQKEATRLERVDARKMNRLETRLKFLKTEESQFQTLIPSLYQKAISAAQRSVGLQDESEQLWAQRLLLEIEDHLAGQKKTRDFLVLANGVRETWLGKQVTNGFMEYGLPALLGLFMVGVWFASISQKDGPKLSTFENREEPKTDYYDLPHHPEVKAA